MNIAITVDPQIPVPPVLYGGIERIVHMLVEGLVGRAHTVTLFAHKDSKVSCRHIPLVEPGRFPLASMMLNCVLISREVVRRKIDVVHSFGRLAHMLPILMRGIPVVMTYQRFITPRSVALGNRFARGRLIFTGVSKKLIEPVSAQGEWRVIYNGVPMRVYEFVDTVSKDAPLVYLGRIEHIKGVHIAIRAALDAGRVLIIAGNIPDTSAAREYFKQHVEPHIDGENIRYMGAVNDAQKNVLLGAAAALLMPILWDEPFGIVMAEALACGTPVIGFDRGAVPEIVAHGINGFVCKDVTEMTTAISRIDQIQRSRCRQTAQTRFSDTVVVTEYERLYSEILASSK